MINYSQAISLEQKHFEGLKEGPDRDQSRENLSFYHNNKGLAAYHKGDFELGLEHYEKAIQFNNNNAENYFNRGNVFLSQTEF